MTPHPDETDVASVLTIIPESDSAYFSTIEGMYSARIEELKMNNEILVMANATLRTKLAAAEGRTVPAVCEPCESAAVQWQRTRFNRLLWFTIVVVLAAAVGWALVWRLW
jgi:hypothetical protein